MNQKDQIRKRLFRIGRILMLSAVLVIPFMACDEDGDEENTTPQPLQTGWWSNSSNDVQFYISQQTKLDTLRITLSFSGACSGSIVSTTYPVNITDRSFSKSLGSSFDGSTGSIQGTFSLNGKSCSGTYEYNRAPCDPINVTWTATPN
jgi:hypothetical protein